MVAMGGYYPWISWRNASSLPPPTPKILPAQSLPGVYMTSVVVFALRELPMSSHLRVYQPRNSLQYVPSAESTRYCGAVTASNDSTICWVSYLFGLEPRDTTMTYKRNPWQLSGRLIFPSTA